MVRAIGNSHLGGTDWWMSEDSLIRGHGTAGAEESCDSGAELGPQRRSWGPTPGRPSLFPRKLAWLSFSPEDFNITLVLGMFPASLWIEVPNLLNFPPMKYKTPVEIEEMQKKKSLFPLLPTLAPS